MSTGYRADVTYEGEARVSSYPQAAASSYKPVQVPAPRSYTPVSTQAPYQQPAPVVVNNPAPATYRDSEPAQSAPVIVNNPAPASAYRDSEPAQSAPVDSFEQASSVEASNAQPGEVIIYY